LDDITGTLHNISSTESLRASPTVSSGINFSSLGTSIATNSKTI